jgi:hemolysin III
MTATLDEYRRCHDRREGGPHGQQGQGQEGNEEAQEGQEVGDPITLPATSPRLRGVLHQWAAAGFGGAGIALVLTASGARARVAAIVYAVSMAGLFGTSALYHRLSWSEHARRMMARLDHSMIFVFIAGSYTPFCLLVLSPSEGTRLLVIVWLGALVGCVFSVAWPSSPRWVIAPLYLALGWAAASSFPGLWRRAGVAAFVLLAVGGLLYSLGAVVYALRRPDPWPVTFGYHEIFHTLTILAAATHFVAIASFAL